MCNSDHQSLCELHRSKVKARVETAYGEWVERIPAWTKWATQVLHYTYPIEIGALISEIALTVTIRSCLLCST